MGRPDLPTTEQAPTQNLDETPEGEIPIAIEVSDEDVSMRSHTTTEAESVPDAQATAESPFESEPVPLGHAETAKHTNPIPDTSSLDADDEADVFATDDGPSTHGTQPTNIRTSWRMNSVVRDEGQDRIDTHYQITGQDPPLEPLPSSARASLQADGARLRSQTPADLRPEESGSGAAPRRPSQLQASRREPRSGTGRAKPALPSVESPRGYSLAQATRFKAKHQFT
ncbi:hypothetical protein PG985_016192 [Apiospora marii]|uniref:uncharacterized protein n=1 Tax=Apiospora marii TaxID=335849 RepID=UPI00312CE178